jgi:ferredoxin, 2Fe-2S
MARVTFIADDGLAMVVDCDEGLSLMECAVSAGVPGIDAECGGNCYCGTCRVYVDPAWRDAVGGQGEYEAPVVATSGDEAEGVRLSCQIVVGERFEGLVVRTPERQT